MKNQQKNKVLPHSFNHAATTYDQYNQMQLTIFDWLMQSISHLTPATILDIGCGTGLLTNRLHNYFNCHHTLGIDQSKAMIEIAKKNNVSTGLTFQQANAMDYKLDFTPDLIFSNATLQWLPDINLFFYNLSKQISSQTQFIASIFLPSTFQELQRGLEQVLGYKEPIAAAQFCTENQLKTIITQHLPQSKFTTFKQHQPFSDVKSLLTTLKHNGTTSRKPAIMWTAQKLHQLDEWFKAEYQAVRVSYEVLGVRFD